MQLKKLLNFIALVLIIATRFIMTDLTWFFYTPALLLLAMSVYKLEMTIQF